jgi:hypothetical protein
MFLMVDIKRWCLLTTDCLIVGSNNFATLDLLELKGLEDVVQYWVSSLSSGGCIWISLFFFLLLVIFSGFNCHLSYFFEKIKEGQKLLSGSRFGFKSSLFLLFELGSCSDISRFVVVHITIVTSND